MADKQVCPLEVIEISWGLSKPLQEANLSWRSQETSVLLWHQISQIQKGHQLGFVNPGPQSGNLDTIMFTGVPSDKFLKNMFSKMKREKKNHKSGQRID